LDPIPCPTIASSNYQGPIYLDDLVNAPAYAKSEDIKVHISEHKKAKSQSAVTSDGVYLYLYSQGFVYKIGSGQKGNNTLTADNINQ